MDTRVDGTSYDASEETWLDERTLPDFDATTVDGEVWPRGAPDGGTAARPPRSLSELKWR